MNELDNHGRCVVCGRHAGHCDHCHAAHDASWTAYRAGYGVVVSDDGLTTRTVVDRSADWNPGEQRLDLDRLLESGQL